MFSTLSVVFSVIASIVFSAIVLSALAGVFTTPSVVSSVVASVVFSGVVCSSVVFSVSSGVVFSSIAVVWTILSVVFSGISSTVCSSIVFSWLLLKCSLLYMSVSLRVALISVLALLISANSASPPSEDLTVSVFPAAVSSSISSILESFIISSKFSILLSFIMAAMDWLSVTVSSSEKATCNRDVSKSWFSLPISIIFGDPSIIWISILLVISLELLPTTTSPSYILSPCVTTLIEPSSACMLNSPSIFCIFPIMLDIIDSLKITYCKII